jgi:hypothetical protein
MSDRDGYSPPLSINVPDLPKQRVIPKPPPRVEFEWDSDEGTLEIIADHYSMVVKLESPFELKGWRNLFESLGVEVNQHDENE